MKQILGLLFIALLISSCGTNTAVDSNGDEIVLHNGPEYFGEKIDVSGAVPLSELQNRLQGQDSVLVTFQAEVEGVCQAKGCWMNLVADEKAEIFVKFKDYAFFMPKDIAGRQVIASGIAYKELTSVDELRHYAEDAGASEEEIRAITEPKEELKFMASGVKLLAEK